MQKIKLIFLPAILITVFLSCSSILFHQAQTILLKSFQSTSPTPALKNLMVFPQIILALSLLILSGSKPFEKVFRGTLVYLIGFIAILYILSSFQTSLQPDKLLEVLKTSLSDHTFQVVEPVIKNWPSSLLYISLNLLNFSLFSLLIWAFINRFTTFSEGVKYFIPFSFIVSFTTFLITYLGFSFVKGTNYTLTSTILPGMVFVIGAILLFDYFWKKLPDQFFMTTVSEIVSKGKRFPFLSVAYLLAGTIMIEHILNLSLRYQVKMQFSDPTSYSKFMGSYSSSFGLLTIIIGFLWVILGTLILSKRGWKFTALIASFSILIEGVIFLIFSFINPSVSWLNQSVMVGVLKGTGVSLFFPLVQILYLCMPVHIRFKTKVLTEMIALPLIKGLSFLAIMSIGSMKAVLIYGKLFILPLLLLFAIASHRIGNKYLTKNC